MTFHMTYDGQSSSALVPLIERAKIPVMVNAVSRYSKAKGRPLPVQDYDTKMVVDSGGYNAMQAYGEYPFGVDMYHGWLRMNADKFDWAAVMDYACEEALDDVMPVGERIDKTLENTIDHFEKDPEYNLLPVLQGRSLQDYVEFYDRLNDHGIPTDRVGLGTVCRLNSSRKIRKVERGLREQTDIDWIHGFGVKVKAFGMGATFDSADSFAWTYPPSYGQYYRRKCGDLNRLEKVNTDSDTATRKSMTFYEYYHHAKALMERATKAKAMGIEI